MAITSTGLETKRFPEIIEELRQELLTKSGNPNLDLSDTSLLGIINAVYANAVAEQQELIQALWGNLEIDSAQGIALDRLVGYIGLTRLTGAKSTGQLLFVAPNTTVIAAGTQVRDTSNRIVQTDSILTINTSGCNRATYTPSVLNGTLYSITINGSTFNYTSDSDATATEIVNGLVSSIGVQTGYTASNVNDTLFINSTTNGNNLTISSGLNQTLSSAGKVVNSTAIDDGDQVFDVGTLTRLVIPRLNVTVTNLTPWLIGRFPETDAQLRLRHQNSVAITGKATVDAIQAKLNQIEGVTKAFVDENPTDVTSPAGLPPHSIECTVKGGTDAAVAQAIWENKGGGIQTYGNITETALDINGTPQEIKFSRPTQVYIHLRITYTPCFEDALPVDTEAAIKQAAFDYGDSLEIGSDVIPSRFLGGIYSAVSGIGVMTVEAARTTLPTDIPTSYSTDKIVIEPKEESNFDIARIQVIEV